MKHFKITIKNKTYTATYTMQAKSSCDAWLAAAERCDCTLCAISVTSKAAQ